MCQGHRGRMSNASCSTSSSTEHFEKTVLLFGKAGSGKSTIANVLVTGGMEREVFKSSDGVNGCTRKLQIATGRGWTVVDTVGLGGADTGSVGEKEAKEMLTNFLKAVQNRYSHVIYVVKFDRITTVDVVIWEAFSSIFEGAEAGFVVLFTHANEKWLEEERDKLPHYMKELGRDRVLVTDIPPLQNGFRESRNVKIRNSSIPKLEEDLDNLFRKRNYEVVVPKIADMSEPELRDMAASIIDRIVAAIQRWLTRDQFQTAVKLLKTLVNISSLVVGLVSLAVS